MLYERRLAATGHVFICDVGERGTLALPPDFTDRGADHGPDLLDVAVLGELARMLKVLQGR